MQFNALLSAYQYDLFLWFLLKHSHFLHLDPPQLGPKTAKMDGHTSGNHSSCVATSARFPWDIFPDCHHRFLQCFLLQRAVIWEHNTDLTILHKGCPLQHTHHVYPCQLQVQRYIPIPFVTGWVHSVFGPVNMLDHIISMHVKWMQKHQDIPLTISHRQQVTGCRQVK